MLLAWLQTFNHKISFNTISYELHLSSPTTPATPTHPANLATPATSAFPIQAKYPPDYLVAIHLPFTVHFKLYLYFPGWLGVDGAGNNQN